MGIETDLRHAARWVGEAAARATEPGFAGRWQALRQAAEQLAEAWSGSWLPPLSNLYQRDLQPLAAPLRVPEDAADTSVSPALQRECRAFSVREIRRAVFQRAKCRNDWDLQDAALTALGLVIDARLSLQAALDVATVQRPGDPRLAEIAAAGQALTVPDQSTLIEAWRPDVSRQHVARTQRVDAAPPHVEVLASLDEMMSPFLGLRRIAALMLAAAECVEGMPMDTDPPAARLPAAH